MVFGGQLKCKVYRIFIKSVSCCFIDSFTARAVPLHTATLLFWLCLIRDAIKLGQTLSYLYILYFTRTDFQAKYVAEELSIYQSVEKECMFSCLFSCVVLYMFLVASGHPTSDQRGDNKCLKIDFLAGQMHTSPV